MFSDPRNLLWQLPLAALLLMPIWKPLAADFLNPERGREETHVSSLTDIRALASSEMSNVHFVQNRKGETEWILTANHLYSTEGDTDLELVDISASFFSGPDKKKKTDISSRKARYNAGMKELRLQGDVVIQSSGGYEMQTESLVYMENEKKIKTDSKVRITGSNISVSGKSLVYDVASGNYLLEGNVVCKVW